MNKILKEYLLDCRLRKLSERTLKGYKNNDLKLLSYLEKEFEVKEISDINYKMIQMYLVSLTEQGCKETYINGLIKNFRAFFEYCKTETYIAINPMDKVRFQKEPIVMINTFTDEEVYSMVKYYNGKKFLDVRNKLIMTILFDSGIRNLELCGIRMDWISETYIKIIGKGNKERHIPITPSIFKALNKYLKIREKYVFNKMLYEDEYLLLSQKGKKLTIESIERIVKDCGISVGVRDKIRCSPHTCRHYYAQAQLRNGCDLFTVSRLLGHTNINITKRYLNSIHDEDFVQMALKTTPLSRM